MKEQAETKRRQQGTLDQNCNDKTRQEETKNQQGKDSKDGPKYEDKPRLPTLDRREVLGLNN